MRVRRLVLSGALGTTALSLDAQMLRDSARVRIRDYAPGALPTGRWTIDPRPLLVIGGASGTGIAELAGVVGVARLSDGRVAVANAATGEIRVFRQDGSFERALGRKRQGPGEFNQLTQFHRSADTVFGTDAVGRLQAFAPDGALLRTLGPPRFPPRTLVTWEGSRADGALIVSALDPPGPNATEFVATQTLGVRDPQSDIVTPIATSLRSRLSRRRAV
jgi:hypothetical protein